MNSNKVYMDHAATTPVDNRVIKAMLPYFDFFFGNPSSVHMYGQLAETALEESRETVSKCLNCRPDEIIFTSCGSESDNLAIRGASTARQLSRGANHILISPTEHQAVSLTARQLARNFGFSLEYLPVDEYGKVDPLEVSSRITRETALVSIIMANNEIGTINPIREIGEICRERKIPFHTDAVQATIYMGMDVDKLNVDLLSLGAHKFYGPKGVGVLYVRSSTPMIPMQTGGSQEFGLRAGTQNIPYIVGLAEAIRISELEREERTKHVQGLRDAIIRGVLTNISDTELTGHPEFRLPNHASFVFKDVDGNALLMNLDIEGFACSSGSACKTGDPEPSDVLNSLNLSPEWSLGSLRISLGVDNNQSDVENLMATLPKAVERIRAISAP